MRDIKFRIWDEKSKQILLVDQIDLTGDQGALVYDEDGNEFYFPDAPLMQFTGLLDKNSKEIWEGDVVRGLHPKLNLRTEKPVVYGAGGFYTMGVFLSAVEDMEVLGNIYENPELLKEGGA